MYNYFDPTPHISGNTLTALDRKIPTTIERTLYVDVTRTAYWEGHPCGVSRTEWEIARHLPELYRGEVKFILRHAQSRAFMEITQAQFLDGSFKSIAKNPDSPKALLKAPHEILKPGSLLLVLGAKWLGDPVYSKEFLIAAKTAKAALVPIIYDIIPIVLPHRFAPGQSAWMRECGLDWARAASLIITISQCSKKDLEKFLVSEKVAAPAIFPIRLGGNFERSSKGEAKVPPAVSAIIGSQPFALCVSAIGPIKNQTLLFDLWLKLIEEFGEDHVPHLICVGLVPPHFKPLFLEWLENNHIAAKKIHLMRNLEDEALEWLYENCLFTLYPSLYEGWGLPVSESLERGKICIASNAASIPEIAPELTDLLDPRDFPGWYEKLKAYIFNESLRKDRETQISNFKASSWQDSARDVCDILYNHTLQPAKWPKINYDSKISGFNDEGAIKYQGWGWNRHKTSSMYIANHQAVIIFRILPKIPGTILNLECQATYANEAVKIILNGQHVQTIRVQSASTIYKIMLPSLQADESGFCDVSIELEIENKNNKSVNKENGPQRIWLHSFYVEAIPVNESGVTDCLLALSNVSLDLRTAFASVIAKRNDIKILLAQSANLPVIPLIWAWRYGIGEDLDLGRHKKEIAAAIKYFYSLKSQNPKLSGMPELLRQIWQQRSDLKFMDIYTGEGQQSFKEWFNKHGVEEYNLTNILKEPLIN